MITKGLSEIDIETKTVVRLLVVVVVLGLVIIMILGSVITNNLHKKEVKEIFEDLKDSTVDSVKQDFNLEFNQTMQKLEEIESKMNQMEVNIKENIETIQILQMEELDNKELTQSKYNQYDLSDYEYNLACKLVESEATGEPYEGKLAVVNVLFNRIEDDWFPDTVEIVVYHKLNGAYQFSVVSDNRINTVKVTQSTIDAVDEYLEYGTNVVGDSLYFINRAGSSESNIKWFDNSLEFVAEIGGHEFFRVPDDN